MESIESKVYSKTETVDRQSLHKLEVPFRDEYNTRLFKGLMSAISENEKSKTKLLDKPGDHSYMVSGSNLPSKVVKSKKKTSMVSDYYIRGYPFVLEDGHTFINSNEALEWAVVYSFSPLMNGNKLNPF